MNGAFSLQENYAAIRTRIRESVARHHRAPNSVALLAVSKTFEASSVLALADCGQCAFGENYLQEALTKISDCQIERPNLPLEWHFIGPIQSNKTRAIAERFDWVHAVDRERIAQRLSDQRPEKMAPLNVCVQVNISGEDSKSGCQPAQALALCRAVAAMPRLRLRGLMALPAPSDDATAQRVPYAAVHALFQTILAELSELDTLSLGMSADLDAAIAEGSTMVRVGTALFGSRPRTPG